MIRMKGVSARPRAEVGGAAVAFVLRNAQDGAGALFSDGGASIRAGVVDDERRHSVPVEGARDRPAGRPRCRGRRRSRSRRAGSAAPLSAPAGRDGGVVGEAIGDGALAGLEGHDRAAPGGLDRIAAPELGRAPISSRPRRSTGTPRSSSAAEAAPARRAPAAGEPAVIEDEIVAAVAVEIKAADRLLGRGELAAGLERRISRARRWRRRSGAGHSAATAGAANAARSPVTIVRRMPMTVSSLRQVEPDVQLAQLLRRDLGGAPMKRSSACWIIGNSVTSRRLLAPTRSITSRSMPAAMPPCGGAPYWKARYMPPKRCSSTSGRSRRCRRPSSSRPGGGCGSRRRRPGRRCRPCRTGTR